MNININIKKFFPIFNHKINKNKLHYLDNAAITQVPDIVIKTLNNFYSSMNSNIHRSAYHLSELATAEYENTRKKIAKFIGANHPEECIFVKNTSCFP